MPSVQTDETHAQASLSFLQHLLDGYHPRDFAVRLWDGSRWEAELGQPTRFTLVLEHPGALRQMFWPPRSLTTCEAYINGDIDIDGDVEAFWALLRTIYQGGLPKGMLERKSLEKRLAPFPSRGEPRLSRHVGRLVGAPHSPERDRQAVVPHYSVSNDFYALWLDSRMVYTCAYFTAPDQDLETAQIQKLDHVCRKLRLRPGQRLLDLGCGWGGLVLHAARHYGVNAVGVTITPAQAEWANRRIREAGLADRCRVQLGDYREIREPNGFDRVAAVGLLEHVGEAMLPTFFRQVWELLRPGGVMLNHAIVERATDPQPVGWPFIYRHVFPDSELLPVVTSLRVGEMTGFEIRDVECVREHYALTLRHWLRGLEARAEEARRLTNEFSYRVFRLYLAASAFGFEIGQPSIYQSVFVKLDEGRSGLPLTRADWYAPQNH
jgi:cyclopropane-fatty-acyl-phospholipid synthase